MNYNIGAARHSRLSWHFLLPTSILSYARSLEPGPHMTVLLFQLTGPLHPTLHDWRVPSSPSLAISQSENSSLKCDFFALWQCQVLTSFNHTSLMLRVLGPCSLCDDIYYNLCLNSQDSRDCRHLGFFSLPDSGNGVIIYTSTLPTGMPFGNPQTFVFSA